MSFIIVGIGAAVAGTALSVHGANKAKKEAEKKEAAAAAEMAAMKNKYTSLDTSNPYMDMENQYEDLTINQAQFELADQNFAMSQSNILSDMGQAAGAGGIASVAQSLVNQGQIQDQKQAIAIAQQERQNELMARQEAGIIQSMEREGEIWSRNQEKDMQGTLLGMAQEETAAYGEQAAAAEQAKWDSISGGVKSIGKILTGGLSDRDLKKNIKLIGKSPSGLKIYSFEYKDKKLGKGRWQGVMSDEIPKHAVIKHKDGHDMVDYSKIDVEFKQINK